MKIFFLVAVLVLAACNKGKDEDKDKEIVLTSIDITSTEGAIPLSLAIGAEQEIIANTVPENVPNVVFKWTSEDNDIAKVSDHGTKATVTGKKAGTTNIVVTSGNVTQKVVVTVTEPKQETLSIAETLLLLEADKDIAVFNIVSNTDWIIEATADWYTVEPLFGKGNAEITVHYSTNIASQDRSSAIKVSTAAHLDKSLPVLQKASTLLLPKKIEYIGSRYSSTTTYTYDDLRRVEEEGYFNVDFEVDFVLTHIYDESGKVVRIVAKGEDATQDIIAWFVSYVGNIVTFTPSEDPDDIVVIEQDNNGNIIQRNNNLFFEYTNGNIVKETNKLGGDIETIIEYDNHPGFYSSINLPNWAINTISDLSFYKTKNNPVKQDLIDERDDVTHVITYTYSYNEHGYPVTIEKVTTVSYVDEEDDVDVATYSITYY